MTAHDATDAPLVVLIEDEPDLRHVLAVVLEQAGWRVASFGTAREGLAAARGLEPELVITDLVLPGPGGIEVANGLTRPDGSRPMPIVLISAHVNRIRGQQITRTFDAVLPKPIDPSALVETVRSLLRSTD